MKIVVASANQKKVDELMSILSDFDVEVVTAKSQGFTDEIIEDGETFEQNALIKAKTVSKALNLPAVADDSGLCVSALGGRPGVYSARYETTDERRCAKLLSEMDGVSNRDAKFVSAIAFYHPNADQIVTVGEVLGQITTEVLGDGGFGYDPVFYVKEFDKTFAELTNEQKNSISHRGRALKQFYDIFKEKNYANK